MICTQHDDFIVNYQETSPCWVAWLNSGLVVYQDDYRPNIEPPSAWARLYNHCKETGDYIINMQIKFRSNVKSLPANADGYYFSKGARGSFGQPKTHQLFFVGTVQHDVLNVTCWKVPEMLEEKTEERNINEAGICLIRKNTNPSLGPKD